MKNAYLVIATAFLLVGSSVNAGTAQKAWNKLVGPRMIKRSAFAYVENNPALPNVLIYGDSISIGYTPQVQKSLADKANVYRLYCNGGDSSSVIAKIDKLHAVMRDNKLDGAWNFEWNVIHFNVGLHDLKYMNKGKLDIKDGQQIASIEQYTENLKSIIAFLKKTAPKAKLIFVTTTPVPEKSGGRKAGDALRYNAAALTLLENYPEIAVNDLYGFTKPHHKKWWTKPGNVHFNKDGCTAQGNDVADLILKVLGKK
ncbi:MAG: SGNH/GDSL hydrolase family protein [Kiritimatiellae bacterium]|jgi:lysophospholipase L1-like esterase|nr:SGNH/GDSL hydrolase family protein [Kiritimatiellia bacterium]